MRCQDFKALIDSYISDELLIETNHEVLRHLENCPDCRSGLAAHRQFRARVHSAVKGSAEFKIDPAFAVRTSSRLRTIALRPTFFERITNDLSFSNGRNLLAALACILLVVFGTVFLVRRSVTPKIVESSANSPVISAAKTEKPESNINQAIRASWDELGHEAVGDHKNCALESNLLEKSISLDEAAKKYGAFNKDIEKVVMSALQNTGPDSDSDDVKLLGAHSCIFAGRRFTHIVLRKKGEIVSVLVADSDSPGSEMVIDSGQIDGNIRVVGFQVGQHAVFVVSSLAAADNDSIARIIAPAVRQHIQASAL